MVKLGFVGAGFMGQVAHIRNYARLAEQGCCRLAALAEPRHDLAAAVARRYGIERLYATHRELIEHESLDALVVIQPFARHIHILPDLLPAGLPILTEKPLSLSVAAAETLVELGTRHRVVHMVGYNKRCDPAVMEARRLVQQWKASGEHGRMRFIRVSVAYPGDWRAGDLLGALSSTEPTPTDGLEPWPVEMGPVLGPRFRWFLDAHCHHLNLPRAFLERGETYRVAYAAPSGHLLVGESVQGITISVELAPYMTTSWREMILVGFEDACLEVHLPPPLAQVPGRVRVYREHHRMPPEPGATWEEPGVPYRFSLGEQARTFLSVVRGEAPPPVDAAEALEDIRTAYAYFRAPVDREVVDNRGMFAVPPAAGK